MTTPTKYLFPQLSNIGRTVGLVESEKEVPTKVLPFFARWLVFSEAWRWVILIKAETNDISVGAKRALHAGMATNHQNMPRKLIIGTQSAMLTSSFLKHQIAETSTTRQSISGSVCITIRIKLREWLWFLDLLTEPKIKLQRQAQKHNLHIPRKIHVTTPGMVIANNIKAG